MLIARDGTVSALQRDTVPAVATVVGRLKLVNPPQAALRRGDDGLFRGQNGAPFEADASVTVESGALESSNVNVVTAMVKLIDFSRSFETQVRTIKEAKSLDEAGASMLKAR